ncbi:MAG: NADH-quinone oxidoreductase subunit N [Phycisphaerae bacterium]|nr:NADH-quinone oxidoreductase subunit N [Phycisphaerae bacterium]
MNDLLTIILPMIILIAGGLLMLMLGLAKNATVRLNLPTITLAVIVFALLITLCPYLFGCPKISPDTSVKLTTLGRFVTFITLAIGALLVLVGFRPDRSQDDPEKSIAGEYFAMMLFSLSGMLMIAVANNLIVLFLGMELVSIPTYVMVGLSRRHDHAREAALKYFFLGAMAAAIMVYGFSFLYGLAGSTNLDVISEAINAGHFTGMQSIAFSLIIVGLCFKIAAVPMHFYAADVYQGAASPVTALLAFLPKLAGFYGLILIISLIEWPLLSNKLPVTVGIIIGLLAALTMTLGNALALMQKNVKRILAYSSIAHSGYMMIALLIGTANNGSGIASLLFYISVYAISTIGAFGILSLIERDGEEAQQLSDLNGLAKQHPALAAALAVCVFSLIGMPLTGGFIGKFTVFSSLVTGGAVGTMRYTSIVLLIMGVVNAAIAAGYYLRIIAACYIDDGAFTAKVRIKPPQAIAIALAVALTIILGVAPQFLASPAAKAASEFSTDIQIPIQQTIKKADTAFAINE